MPESEQHITVTAEERAHPAVLKLARACLALARLGRTGTPPALPPDDPKKRPAAAPESST